MTITGLLFVTEHWIQRLWVSLISLRIAITQTNQGMSSQVYGPVLAGHDPDVAQLL
jgi:hypothetical protein